MAWNEHGVWKRIGLGQGRAWTPKKRLSSISRKSKNKELSPVEFHSLIWSGPAKDLGPGNWELGIDGKIRRIKNPKKTEE